MQLVIESATRACSVALIGADGALIDERHEVVGRGHAERLVPMIGETLASRRPLSLVVDCGPGSFTGVRVGLAAAHGLALGWGIPLTGYSSLALLAAAADAPEVAVALEGGHGELFVQSYAGAPIAPVTELRSLPPAVAAAAVGFDLVVGSGAEALVAARGYGRWSDIEARAGDVGLLPADLRKLEPGPIYGRAPDAKRMTPA